MGVIRAAHYDEAVAALVADPIIIDMAGGLAGVDTSTLAHEDGTARFEFMQAANREYADRGGTISAHIGGVAEALLKLL